VLAHSFVIGELACENLKARKRILTDVHTLPLAISATDEEVSRTENCGVSALAGSMGILLPPRCFPTAVCGHLTGSFKRPPEPSSDQAGFALMGDLRWQWTMRSGSGDFSPLF